MAETLTPPLPAKQKKRYVLKGGWHHEPVPAGHADHLNPLAVNRVRTLTKGDVIETERDMQAEYPGKFDLATEDGGTVVVTDERRQSVAQLIASSTYTEEDRGFLERLSNDGFERVVRASTPKQVEGKVSSPLGDDVTHKFQVAYDNGYLVFVNGTGKHQVTRRNESTKPLNKAPLDVKGVDPFVLEHMKQ